MLNILVKNIATGSVKDDKLAVNKYFYKRNHVLSEDLWLFGNGVWLV